MFDSLEQGIFMVDSKLKIMPHYSAHLADVLRTTEIAGRDCVELLFNEATLERSSDPSVTPFLGLYKCTSASCVSACKPP